MINSPGECCMSPAAAYHCDKHRTGGHGNRRSDPETAGIFLLSLHQNLLLDCGEQLVQQACQAHPVWLV